MSPSDALQKLDGLLLFANNEEDDNLREQPADEVSKVENIRQSAQNETDVVKFLKERQL